MAGFDIDELVAQCRGALSESQPALAVRDILERTVADSSAVSDVLAVEEAGLTGLYQSDDITVVRVMWAPGMSLYPHDHRMWATIGVFTGVEDNHFYRRSQEHGLDQLNVKPVDERDVLVMGDDVIHSVTNRQDRFTGAIHVYGGDFFGAPRSEFDPETFEEMPYSVPHTNQVFADANAAYRASKVSR
jgi:predicted metal-dependent enzyme (double-stranded beta helix superfamily)